MNIPLYNRLSVRLTLLILVVVAVLAGATAIVVTRGFNLAQQGALEVLQALNLSELPPEEAADLSAIVRATLINLIAVFLLTLVGATLFSRSLLTEPITNLVRGTRELKSGNLGTTLPVTSRSELGLLASDFNQMSLALLEARDHLERRVEERTAELRALLELSNSTALTYELDPLLNQILDRLGEAVGFEAAVILERHGTELTPLTTRGEAGLDDEAAAKVLSSLTPVLNDGERSRLTLPLIARQTVLGVMALEGRPGHFGEARVNLALAFANQVAVALENTRLQMRVQERAAYEERQHLARELHDSVSQALYAILLGTHAAQRQLGGDPEQAGEALRYVEGLAQAGIAEMRALIFELRPESLEEEGLSGALGRQMEAMESRHGLETEVSLEGEPELPLATKQVLYRVAQEALHNVVKHARASRVRLTLRRSGDRSVLEVGDDGVGFDPEDTPPGHLGLRSMRERVEESGGEFCLLSTPGRGTEIRVAVPEGTEV